jgi:hypothetical protein
VIWGLLLTEDQKSNNNFYLTFDIAMLKPRKRKRKICDADVCGYKEDIKLMLNFLMNLTTT